MPFDNLFADGQANARARILLSHMQALKHLENPVVISGFDPDPVVANREQPFISTRLGFDFDAMVAGHLGRLATRKDVETQKEYILDVQANAAEALQTVDFFGIAQETGFQHSWLLFDTYLNTVAQVCTDLTLSEWGDQLGDADVFTLDHCFVMAESLRID